MKYRKKPVVIEAFQWTGDQDQTEDPEWIIEAIKAGTVWFEDAKDVRCRSNVDHMVIETLEGNHRANRYDFIIQGINGELYPCKPDIFEATYESVMAESEGGDYCRASVVEREMIPRPAPSEVIKALYDYESAVEERERAATVEQADYKAANECVIMTRLALLRLMGLEVKK